MTANSTTAPPEPHASDLLATPTWAHYLTEDIDAAHATVNAWLFSASWPRPGTKFARRGTYDYLIAALRAAAARGVTITITTCAPTARIPSTQKAHWMAERMQADGIHAMLHTPPPILHAKVWIIDHRITWIGSANLTPRACEQNVEMMLRTDPDRNADILPEMLACPPRHHRSTRWRRTPPHDPGAAPAPEDHTGGLLIINGRVVPAPRPFPPQAHPATPPRRK